MDMDSSNNLNKEDKKLDWMYKDSSQIVDPEEYLLGRKVDKQFEKNAPGLSSEKDQECLPSSMFIGLPIENQVDAARKLQEDPLFLIKKREIESREQLLKNPRKLKQLQEMVAKQQAAAEKLERKRLKKQKKEKNKHIDELLAKKCMKIFGGLNKKKLEALESSSESSSSSDTDKKKKKRKKKKKNHTKDLDSILNAKYNKLIGSIDLKKITDELSSSTSESEVSDQSTKPTRKRHASASSDDTKSYNSKPNKYKPGKQYADKYSSYENSNKPSKSSNQERHCSNLKQDDRHMHSKHIKEKHKQSATESDDSVEDKKTFKHKNSAIRVWKNHDDKMKHRNKPNNKYSSDTSDSEIVKDIRKNRQISKSKKRNKDYEEEGSSLSMERRSKNHSILIKKQVRQSQRSSSSSSNSDNSSNENKEKEAKHYGLVLPANYKPKEKAIEKTPVENEKSVKLEVKQKEPRRKLTEEEKEQKLKEMMDNVKWRDDLREKNIKSYKEKEKTEKDNYTYNEDFMRNQMSYAVSQGTVESRVKANINTIQRSKGAMDEHFARRK